MGWDVHTAETDVHWVLFIFITRQQSCGKVMFSVLSGCLFTGWGWVSPTCNHNFITLSVNHPLLFQYISASVLDSVIAILKSRTEEILQNHMLANPEGCCPLLRGILDPSLSDCYCPALLKHLIARYCGIIWLSYSSNFTFLWGKQSATSCGQKSRTTNIRWTVKVLGAYQMAVFMSRDLGGKQSHAFPQKTIKMNWIELKTSYFCKISLPYPLKLTKYQVLTPKTTFIEINLSKTLKNAENHSINMFPH